jgi:hypothetical protein
MKRPLNFLIIIFSLLSGCATTRSAEVALPTGNIATVYQPPTVRAITFEFVAVVFLIAMVLFVLIEKLWHEHRKNKK